MLDCDLEQLQRFDERLAGFSSCSFEALADREDIETLVQEYLDSPGIQHRHLSARLLLLLFRSEYFPLLRLARSGVDSSDFLSGRSTRLGRWMIYVSVGALWACALYCLAASNAGRWLRAIA
jgi:hypothetical protein